MINGRIIDLTNSLDDSITHLDQGESFDITGAFVDGDGVAVALASIVTFTITIYNEDDSAIINSRSNQTVLNANGGTVTSGGAFTLRLDADDSPIVSSDLTTNDEESHIIKLTWTWSDGVSTRTGIQELRVYVRKLATPV